MNNQNEGVGLPWVLKQLNKKYLGIETPPTRELQHEETGKALNTAEADFMRPGSFEIGETLDHDEKMEQFDENRPQ